MAKIITLFLKRILKTRTKRLKERGDLNDKIQRRIDADEIDFKDFKDYDILINNSNF